MHLVNWHRNSIDNHLFGVNQTAFDENGSEYIISIDFQEATFGDNWGYSKDNNLTGSGNPYMKINVVDEVPGRAVARMRADGSRIIDIGAYDYKGFSHDIPHEVLHWLGQSHSADTESIMWPYTRGGGDNLRGDEVINLVKGYIE